MERKVRSGVGGLAQTMVVFPSVPMAPAITVTGSQGEVTSIVVPVLNALLPMFGESCDVKVTEVSPEQPLNAFIPMDVTDSGIVIEVNPEQFWNALYPIEVTDSGMVIEVSPEHPENV